LTRNQEFAAIDAERAFIPMHVPTLIRKHREQDMADEHDDTTEETPAAAAEVVDVAGPKLSCPMKSPAGQMVTIRMENIKIPVTIYMYSAQTSDAWLVAKHNNRRELIWKLPLKAAKGRYYFAAKMRVDGDPGKRIMSNYLTIE
jgi:hypothetical protein